jgi:hypothetical protein
VSFSGADLSAITHVRNLLQRFAAPHGSVRLLTQEVEQHISALTPQLTVLNPQPFGSLSAPASQDSADNGQQPALARRAKSVEGGTGKGRTRSREEFTAVLKQPANASVKLSEPVKKSSVATSLFNEPLPVSKATTPESGAKAPDAKDKARRRAVAHESVIPAHAESRHAEPAKQRGNKALPAAQNETATKAEAAKVDVGALAQRLLDKSKRQNENVDEAERPGARTPERLNARAPERKKKPLTLPGGPTLPIPMGTPVLRASSGSKAKFQLPSVVRLNRAGAPLPSPSSKPSKSNPAVEQSAPDARRPSPGARAPERPTTRPPEQAFMFDAFEHETAEQESDFALTQRIDQILREQARRQGVDLT